MTEATTAAIPADTIQADPAVQSWHIWQARRQEVLTGPHNYLAPVSITWLTDGDDTRIDGFPGSWSARGDQLVYVPDAESPATSGGDPVSGPLAFTATDFGEQALGLIRVGDLWAEANAQTSRIDPERHDFWIRIKDPAAARRRDFHGIEHFPVDPAWRLPATFEPVAHDHRTVERHDSVVSDVLQAYEVLGTVHFRYQGEAHALTVSNVFGRAEIFFTDTTTGHATAGNGRTLELSAAAVLGLDAIDFNYATNYPCAFSPYCTCPVPLPGNRLPFAVTAGEKTPFEALS